MSFPRRRESRLKLPMKKLFIFVLLVFVDIVLLVNPTYAQSKVLINEFLIDPQPQSVEIFNSGSESADVSDWIIDDSGGTTFYTIPKDSIIFPNQCLIFSADFNLNKTSADTVRLINNSQQLIDSFSYKSSSGSGITYYRFPDNDNYWTTGSANLGFYNQTNISCLVAPTTTPTPTLTPTLTITPTVTITPIPTATPTCTGQACLTPTITSTPQSYDNIFISEAMVNPATGEKEWVEIYNDNDFPVSLKNWFIDDLENAGSSPKIFSLEIDKKNFAVFNLTSSMFNNDGDNVRLLDFNKNLKDDFEYLKAEQGKTLGRTSFDSDDFCLQEPSKNSANNPCINPSPTMIASIKTEQINLSPTINNVPSKIPVTKANNFDVSIHRSINYPTGVILNDYDSGDVLGAASTVSNNSSLLIRCLTFVSFSYSLLVIVSVLIKSKILKRYVKIN